MGIWFIPFCFCRDYRYGLDLPAVPVVLADHKEQKQSRNWMGNSYMPLIAAVATLRRYPTERTDAQWKTILMHMQVRANLPPEQARKILKYMKDNN